MKRGRKGKIKGDGEIETRKRQKGINWLTF